MDRRSVVAFCFLYRLLEYILDQQVNDSYNGILYHKMYHECFIYFLYRRP